MGDDHWAIYSQDGSLAAHFEFTIAVTADGPRILTPWHEATELRVGLRYTHLVALAAGRVCRPAARFLTSSRKGS